MKLANKNVLVTGAEGFIGSHLVEGLVRQGAKVSAFVFYNFQSNLGNLELIPKDIRREIKVICGDIQDYGMVQEAVKGNSVVFHLAALIAIPYSYRARQASGRQASIELAYLRPAREWALTTMLTP